MLTLRSDKLIVYKTLGSLGNEYLQWPYPVTHYVQRTATEYSGSSKQEHVIDYRVLSAVGGNSVLRFTWHRVGAYDRNCRVVHTT